jgi:sugar transferase (PEP-CTERM system associated)
MVRVFRHYISGAFLGLILFEATAFFSALYLGMSVRFYSPEVIDSGLFVPSLIYTVIMLICMTGMGLYQRNQGWSSAATVLRMLGAFLLGVIGMSLVFYTFPELLVGRGVLGFTLLFSVVGVSSLRALFYRYADNHELKRHVLILGAGKDAQKILDLEQNKGHQNIHVVGCVAMPGELPVVDEKYLLSPKVSLIEFVTNRDVDEIVVAPDDRRLGLPVDDLLDCKMSGFEVVDLLTFFEREAGIILVDSLHPSWLVFSDGFRSGTIRDITKRLFDITVSLAILICTSPFFILAALAVYLESGGNGPIFYYQTRVGMNWQLFKVIKFRSMSVDAEKNGAQWASKNDSRVTRVGGFIRKCRIDELPQIFNVLKGDMSFVGPRPERPEFVEKFTETIPFYVERHRVKPGITGWAQLCYPYGASEDDAVEKLKYDLYYVKNYSLFLDLLIILQTTEVVLWGKGAQ